MCAANRRQFLTQTTAALTATGLVTGGGQTVRLASGRSAIPATHRDPQDHSDPNLHLLVDDHEIARSENVSRVLNRMHKHPRPVLVADRPWEGERAQAWGSVIQEPDGLFRMWYFAFNTERRWDELDRGGYCYAESRDGLHWTKPDLNLFEFRGSKRNNLFYSCAPDGVNLVDEELARRGLGLPAIDEKGETIGVINNLDGLTVVRDDDDPDPQKRYKLIANMQDHRMWAPYNPKRYPNVTTEQVKKSTRVFGQYMDTSPDGIHWTRRPQRLMAARGGDYMMVTRDHRNKQWWLNERAHDQEGRNASLRTSKDWKQWSDLEVIFGKDSDPNFNRTFQWHGGMTPFNYGNLNLGLLEIWPLAGHGATCELISQREGDSWQRTQPGHPFLDIGPEKSFDRMLAYPSHNPPGKVGDRLYFFYTGAKGRNHPRKGMPMSMGLATIGLDRFAGLSQWRSIGPGVVISKPMPVAQPQLAINIEYFEYAPLRVGVTRPDGTPIAGFRLEDSRIELRPDAIYSWARWKDKPDLSELVGQAVSFHFEVVGAALYSFRFYPQRVLRQGDEPS